MKRMLIAALASLLMAACGNGMKGADTASAPMVGKGEAKVIYLHRGKGCATCMAIRKVLADAQEGWAKEEVKKGRVEFVDATFGTPEGDRMAERLQKASPTLLVVKSDTTIDLTLTAFSNARANPEALEKELKKAVGLNER